MLAVFYRINFCGLPCLGSFVCLLVVLAIAAVVIVLVRHQKREDRGPDDPGGA